MIRKCVQIKIILEYNQLRGHIRNPPIDNSHFVALPLVRGYLLLRAARYKRDALSRAYIESRREQLIDRHGRSGYRYNRQACEFKRAGGQTGRLEGTRR